MVFVILGVACVAVLLFFVLIDKNTYKRNSSGNGQKTKRVKEPKYIPPKDISSSQTKPSYDPDLEVDFKQIDYNTFKKKTKSKKEDKEIVLKDADDNDEKFDPSVNPFKQEQKNEDDFFDFEDQMGMDYNTIFSGNLDDEEDDFEEMNLDDLGGKPVSIGNTPALADAANFKFENDDDDDGFLNKYNLNSIEFEDDSISEKFKNLPDDLKALFLVDIFKKKSDE